MLREPGDSVRGHGHDVRLLPGQPHGRGDIVALSGLGLLRGLHQSSRVERQRRRSGRRRSGNCKAVGAPTVTSWL